MLGQLFASGNEDRMQKKTEHPFSGYFVAIGP